MKKKVLSMILAIAMVVSMFAGLATTASAAADATYTLVTDASTLQAGDIIVIALAAKGKAAGVKSGDYLTAVDGTFGDTLTSTDAVEFTLGGDATGWTLTSSEGTLGATAAKKLSYTGGTTTWTISITDGAATIASTNSAYGRFLYNNGSPRFLNYTSAESITMILPEIYKKTTATTPDCEHANTEERAEVAATCTEVGYTAGVFCTDCQTYISGHETIEALDHAWDEGVETLAATCTAAGKMTYTCTREGCGATKTEATPLAAHNYVDNVCSVCGTVNPASVDYTGLYYISVDNTYMTSNLTTGTNKRYVAVAAELAEDGSLPTSVTLTAADEKTFSIEKQEDGSYVIRAASVEGDNYLTYASNAGNIGAADAAIKVSIVERNGVFTISNDTVDTVTRYLAKNNTASNMYYGWYKSGQHDTLTLIPVTIDTEAHVHSYAWDGNVGVDGSHTLVCECGEASMQEACADAEPVYTAGNCRNYGSTAYTCDVCGYAWTVADTELGDHNYVDGTCTVCGAEKPADQNYALVTGTIAEGDYVIYYNGKAMNTTVASNRLQYLEVAPVNDVITNPDAAIVWHIAPSGDYWTIYNAVANSYAAATGTKNQATMNADGTDDKSLWTITGEGAFEIVNKSNAAASVNAYLRNNGTYGFACYGSGTGGALTLYKLTDEVTCNHQYTYASNENGTHTATCSLCGNEFTEACSGDPTEEGGSEFECVKCGYMWTLNQYTMTTTVADGDHIIIYNAANKAALGAEASGTKLSGVSIPDSYVGTTTILAADGVAVLTVADYADGQFHLVYNDQYLTAPATGDGLSFAAAAAEGETDYALWTIVDGQYIKNVNAAYNTNEIYLEYFSGFTSYSAGTGTKFQMTIYSDNVACTHTSTELVNAVAATCITSGYSGDTVCADCGATITAGAEIPALGHNFVDGTCDRCSATQLTATNVTSLTDGAKVYIYNAASGYVLTGTAARTAGYFAGVPSTVEGDVLTTSSDALLLTVHVVEGGYKFENNGLYLTYGDDRTTLSLAEDSDHAVWALDASYHLISVNDNYLFNGEASDLYLQTYTKAGGFTCYATSNLTDYFVLSFYDPSAAVCEHVWNAGEATPPATCVDAGIMTYTCTLCGVTKTEVIEATGVHTYGDDHVCTVCGAVDVAAFDFSGNYYIATMRATGNYFWMTNDTSTGTRYTAVDSGLTELPSEITSDVDAAKVWTLEKQEDGTYLLSSNGMYSTWSSGNTAAFGETGLALTLAKTGDIFTISFVSAEPATRYLSLNANSGNNYFAFYKGSQKQELSLIPVAAETPVTHTALYFEGQAATCTTEGVVAYWYCAECLENGEHYGKCYSDEAMTDEIAAENLVIAALGHSYIYTNNGDDHTVTCSNEGCDYTVTEAHTFVDGTCLCGAVEATDPIVDSNLKFTNH
ncbi:MAG: hypothetical protein ACI3VU_06740, partial [Faecousia sp.]